MACVARPKAKRTLQEFALIRSLQRRFGQDGSPIIQGIGDDAAVVPSHPHQWLVITTDLLAEHIHFDLRTASFESVGYRAAMANLSDLAAMGATPRYGLVSLAIPKGRTQRDVDQLYRGMRKACRPHGVRLIGGDTSASQKGLFLNVTLIGTTAPGHVLFRRGARIGEGIYVTGTLGDARAGLYLLQESLRTATRQKSRLFPRSHRNVLIGRHLHPTARVREGRWLNRSRFASSAIDLSDGLSGDLRHVCAESNVGALVELDRVPISPSCRAYAESKHIDPVQLALAGGEDYELLFTVASKHQARMERQARNFGFHIARIGTIRPRDHGIRAVFHDGSVRPLPNTSYEHFR
jgi:thiamine-monophosphate kinase